MRLPGKRKLETASRWLRSRFGSRSLILGYHRIAAETWDPFSLAVSPAHFAEHLQVIKRYGAPVPLRALAQSLNGEQVMDRAIALTFDDGYSDIFDTVIPLLEEHQIAATVFVVSGNLGREFWWDELARTLAPTQVSGAERSVDIALPDRDLTLARPGSGEEVPRQLLELQRSLQALGPDDREQVIQRIRSAFGGGVQNEEAPVHRCVNEEELVRLAGNELIDVGAHTHSHVELGRLSEARQASEIAECKRVLENAVGDRVDAFSYPHGSTPAASREILERSGFLSGCTSVRDVVRRGTDRLLLPRLWVSDVDGEGLSRQLHGWLGRRHS